MSTPIETLALALALLLATSVAAAARNDQVGQSPWCWVSDHSDVAFCVTRPTARVSRPIAARNTARASKNDEPSPSTALVSAASAPEYQPGRVLIDVFDRLVQLGKGTAAIDGEGRELLEAGI